MSVIVKNRTAQSIPVIDEVARSSLSSLDTKCTGLATVAKQDNLILAIQDVETAVNNISVTVPQSHFGWAVCSAQNIDTVTPYTSATMQGSLYGRFYTLYGNCAVGGGASSVTITIQYSFNDTQWYDSSNNLLVSATGDYSLEFEASVKFIRISALAANNSGTLTAILGVHQ